MLQKWNFNDNCYYCLKISLKDELAAISSNE